MNQRLNNAIGLCKKAGKCFSGGLAVETAIKQGKTCLVILQQDASDNTKKQYQDLCAYYNVPLMMAQTVGHAIGQPNRMVMAVKDENFKKMIESACEHNSQEIRG